MYGYIGNQQPSPEQGKAQRLLCRTASVWLFEKVNYLFKKSSPIGGDFIFDENQLVTVKWHNSNKSRLVSLGYKYTHIGDEIQIKAAHLLDTSKEKVSAICDYCGSPYKSTVGVLRNGIQIDGTNACRNCAAKKSRKLDKNKRSKVVFDRLIRVCGENNYKLITVDDGNLNVGSNVKYECPVHGEQSSIADNLIRGHKCYYCGRINVGNKLRKPIDVVVADIESVNGNKLLNPNEYIDMKEDNLNVLCSCGNIFTVSYNNYMNHNVCRCKTCSSKTSVGEKLIEDILDDLTVDYTREYRYKDCRDKKPLPFDFYLNEYNKIIEFDGQIHFKEVEGRNHEQTVKHDKIKNKYCSDHNIPLLRIPYWESNNAKNLIIDFLNR